MKILVPIDSSPNAPQALRYAVAFAESISRDTTELHRTSNDILCLDFFKKLVQLWQAKVDIIHIHLNPAKVKMELAQGALNLNRFLRGIPYTYHFIEDKFIRGIQQYLIRSSADLVAVVPRYRSKLERLFHKSVTKQLVKRGSLPVLSTYE